MLKIKSVIEKDKGYKITKRDKIKETITNRKINNFNDEQKGLLNRFNFKIKANKLENLI